MRVSDLCKRSALLQHGNALAAMGKQDDARASYEKVLPLIASEPRCARVDWERHSVYINIGNTFSRSGEFDLAYEQFRKAESLGDDHLAAEEGSKFDGNGMILGAKRARAFAMKKAGKEDEAKALLREVIEGQIKLNMEEEANKKKQNTASSAAAAVTNGVKAK